MDKKILYTTSFGRTILSSKREISRILHGKKKPVDMDLYVGDLLWPYEGQPTISQYYLAARYLDAKLVKEGIFDKSYCEELSRAYRGTANSKEKSIEAMKKFKVFLDSLEEDGFNPNTGRFSVANDSRGLFFDDGTHRLAGLLLNKVKYIPVRIEDRNTKYNLNGREILQNSALSEEFLSKLDSTLNEIRGFYSFNLIVLASKKQSADLLKELAPYGSYRPALLSNVTINKKYRIEDIPIHLLDVYYGFKNGCYEPFDFNINNNHLFFKNNQIYSHEINLLMKNTKKKALTIVPSLTETANIKGVLSRANN